MLLLLSCYTLFSSFRGLDFGAKYTELWEKPPLDTLNARNGLLDIATRQLRPHSKDFLSPVQLPVNYEPLAQCPSWESFVRSTFPDDAYGVAWEIVAWLAIPDTSIQKAILLIGEGGNGKSVFLRAITSFLGKQNTVGLSLHKLESDRFAIARLVGKLANICPDLPSAHLAGTSIFKAITGGDRLDAERKYCDGFDFQPFARLVFSANHPPRSDDASHAFFRRWLVIPFNKTFEPNTDAYIPQSDLDLRLADPKELSGVLNKALDALANLRTNGFSESNEMRKAWHELRESTDSLAGWLDSETIENPDAMIPKQDLFEAYRKVCQKSGRPPLTNTAFGKTLKRLRPKINEAQRTIAGKITWVWIGIGLKSIETEL